MPVEQAAWLSYCRDLGDWPRSWMVWSKDLSSGQKIVESFKPFLQYLSQLPLSRKTVRKHVDNLWILGGEIIRDLHETPSLRKVPVEDLVLDVVKEGRAAPVSLRLGSAAEFVRLNLSQAPPLR